jgi:hypothetical protein
MLSSSNSRLAKGCFSVNYFAAPACLPISKRQIYRGLDSAKAKAVRRASTLRHAGKEKMNNISCLQAREIVHNFSRQSAGNSKITARITVQHGWY